MSTSIRHMPPRGVAGLLLFLVLALVGLCGATSLRWYGTTFPGFLVLDNRVVASVSLTHWPVAQYPGIYQQTVSAVNGQPVATTEELYTAVRHLPPESPVVYTLEKDGRSSDIVMLSRTFGLRDYVLLFGAALFTGLAIIVLGIGVWFLKPHDPAARTLALACMALGVFCITVLDLYGPARFFRLHAWCEAFFPLGFVRLGMIFPVDWIRRHRRLLLALPYGAAVVLGIIYEIVLYRPAAYSFVHNPCMLNVGLGGLSLAVGGWRAYRTTSSHLIRQRIRVILLGLFAGFAFPSLIMGYSGIIGGAIAVNYTAFTAFLFPFSIGYAIVKHDLFEIDILLKRGVFYLTLTALLTSVYLVVLVILNFVLHAAALIHSPLFPLLFTLIALLLFNPLKDHLQTGVDRIFFRMRYDPKTVLGITSASLASMLRLEEILSFLWRTASDTLGVRQGGIFLLAPDSEQYVQVWPRTAVERCLSAAHPLVQAVRRKGSVVTLENESQEEGGAAIVVAHHDVGPLPEGAQALVPLSFQGDLIGLLALGRKESGAFFSVNDRDFLATLANQGAVSIANALSYQEIQLLNAKSNHMRLAQSLIQIPPRWARPPLRKGG